MVNTHSVCMKPLQLQISTQSEADPMLLHSFLHTVKHLREFIIIIIIIIITTTITSTTTIIILIIYLLLQQNREYSTPRDSSVHDITHWDQTRPADAHDFWAK